MYIIINDFEFFNQLHYFVWISNHLRTGMSAVYTQTSDNQRVNTNILPYILWCIFSRFWINNNNICLSSVFMKVNFRLCNTVLIRTLHLHAARCTNLWKSVKSMCVLCVMCATRTDDEPRTKNLVSAVQKSIQYLINVYGGYPVKNVYSVRLIFYQLSRTADVIGRRRLDNIIIITIINRYDNILVYVCGNVCVLFISRTDGRCCAPFLSTRFYRFFTEVTVSLMTTNTIIRIIIIILKYFRQQYLFESSWQPIHV